MAPPSDHALPDTSDLNLDKPVDGALVGTLPPDFTPTPSSHLGLPVPWPQDDAEKGRRFNTLFGALAVVVTLAALIVLLLIYLNG